MTNVPFRLFVSATLLSSMLAVAVAPASDVLAVSPDIVISQVYGGGGNAGAPYLNDFVELFNRGTTTTSLSGMSVQYASATGTGNFAANAVTPLSGSLAPGQYYLAQLAGGANGVPLPTPDATGTVNMSGTAGKVALVNSTTGLACNGSSAQPCSASDLALIKDLVGYGTANFSEGTPAPTLSSTTAALRLANGCTDTDNNASDFTASGPTPRNTASTLNPCVAADTAPAVAGTFPVDGATDFPTTGNLSVTFSEAVNVTSSWYTLLCSSSGSVVSTFSGGPTTFTIDPGATLIDGETCTLTVLASEVSDQDGNDPPDNLVANFVVSFVSVDVCAATYTPIPTIQGSGLSTTIPGTVTTEGVVVGDFEGTAGAQGFYLQDLDRRRRPGHLRRHLRLHRKFRTSSAWDRSFASRGSHASASTRPRSTARTATRRRCQRRTSCTAARARSPRPTWRCRSLTSTAPERFEGMLVRLPQTLVIAEYFNYDRFGEIVLALPLGGETRPFTRHRASTSRARPRTLAHLPTACAGSRSTMPSAPRTRQCCATRTAIPSRSTNRFRGGDTVQNTVGVLGFDFSLYRIYPDRAGRLHGGQPAAGRARAGRRQPAGRGDEHAQLLPHARLPNGDPLDNAVRRRTEPRVPRRGLRPADRVHAPARQAARGARRARTPTSRPQRDREHDRRRSARRPERHRRRPERPARAGTYAASTPA